MAEAEAVEVAADAVDLVVAEEVVEVEVVSEAVAVEEVEAEVDLVGEVEVRQKPITPILVNRLIVRFAEI